MRSKGGVTDKERLKRILAEITPAARELEIIPGTIWVSLARPRVLEIYRLASPPKKGRKR